MLSTILIFIITGLVMSAPLLILGMGGVVTERSGTLNLGLEGMMLVGAFFSYFGAFTTGSAALGLLIGMLAAMIVALVQGIAMIYWNANQVVTAVAMNMICLGLTTTLFGKFFATSSPGTNVSPGISAPFTAQIGDASIGITWFLIIAVVLIPVTQFVFHKTTWGLKIRAVGEYPQAAATMGVKVRRIRMISLLYTGLIAGLAGSALSIGDVRTFTMNMTAGKGFIAFACIVFGRYTPIGTAIGCLVFGMSEALRNFIQIFKWDAVIPGGYMTAIMIPYIITLLLLVFSKKGVAPKAWAVPYESADE